MPLSQGSSTPACKDSLRTQFWEVVIRKQADDFDFWSNCKYFFHTWTQLIVYHFYCIIRVQSWTFCCLYYSYISFFVAFIVDESESMPENEIWLGMYNELSRWMQLHNIIFYNCMFVLLLKQRQVVVKKKFSFFESIYKSWTIKHLILDLNHLLGWCRAYFCICLGNDRY